MSLYSGDSTIIRNGRSSSEISIYDYPEHLNPFYEDENHKRIRFWKIGKNKKFTSQKGGSERGSSPSRRNSFSFGGLKDMWAFKSFRPKKSSTLGVNKTSESPPRLEVVDIRDTNYGTLDNKSRHSTGLYNGNGQQFQRNVPYRSSLQDMRYQSTSPNFNRTAVGGAGGGFGRNEMYRATIQTPTRMNRTTNNNGMIVRSNNYSNQYHHQPTPSPRLQASDRRSSQLSVASSTNPFEDDDDIDDNNKENIISRAHYESSDGLRTASNTNSLTRPSRKKRRAPPPPIPISNVIEEEPAKKDENSFVIINGKPSQHNTNIKTSQDHVTITTPETEEISNLTAEIESFVNQTVQETNSKKDVPPTPPERKYFKENINKIESDISNKQSNIPTSNNNDIVMIEEKQKNVSIKLPPVIIIKEASVDETDDDNEEKKLNYEIITTTQRKVVNESPSPPQKLIVKRSVVQTSEVVHSTTVPDGNNVISSNEKILNTDHKPVPTIRKITETQNKSIVIEENSRNAVCNTMTSPKKEKPPLSPKPNFVDIQVKKDEEQRISDRKLQEAEQKIELIESKKQNSIESKSNNNSELVTCRYDQLPIGSCELKITESTEDVSAEIANEIVSLPYVPLKSDSPINNELVTNNGNLLKSSSQNEIKENVELSETKLENNLLNNIRPRSHFTDEEFNKNRPIKCERKKSVREIIESINKNQSLLKLNNNTNGTGTEKTDIDNIKTNNLGEPELKALDESQRDFKRLLFEIENYDCRNRRTTNSKETFNNNNNNDNNNNNVGEIDEIFNKIDELKKNENIFKKCTATHHINGNTTITTTTVTTSSTSSREASPTASNLDWNPVPKPKRTKKLNNDLTITRSSPDSCNEII